MNKLEFWFCKQAVVTSNEYSVKLIFRHNNIDYLNERKKQDRELANRPIVLGGSATKQEREERQFAAQRVRSGYWDQQDEIIEDLEIPRCKECMMFHNNQDIWFIIGSILGLIVWGLVSIIWNRCFIGALFGFVLFSSVMLFLQLNKNKGRDPMAAVRNFPEVEERKNSPYKVIK